MKIISTKPIVKYIAAVIMIAAVLLGVFIIWRTNPIEYELFRSEGITYVRGKVASVNSETVEDSKDTPGRTVGQQNITVRLTTGERKNEEVTFDNYLTSGHSVYVGKGTRVIVKCDAPEGITPVFSLYQYDRSTGIIAAGAIFILILCLVGRGKGAKAALALGISVVIIAFALIPAIYNGHSPIAATLAVCVLISAITLILLNGFSKKTYVAIVSTITGSALSILMYLLIAKLLSVNGYALEETEDLIMISRKTGLKIGDVLFSGILLASLGAVMDTAMSISSALFEMSKSMKKQELFRSGINIGRDMIGTMCQTLVLAFAGSSIASLLVLTAYGTRFDQFLSSDYLAVEVFRSLTGSCAVVFTVPLTAFIASRAIKK